MANWRISTDSYSNRRREEYKKEKAREIMNKDAEKKGYTVNPWGKIEYHKVEKERH